MTAHQSNVMLAYWLIPAEPERSFFASIIAELSSRLEAPLFEPHVTVYAADKGDEIPPEVLADALRGFEPLRLSVSDVRCSDEFTKTVFVQFQPSLELARLSSALQEASAYHDEYQLNPHLSLIYKEMTEGDKIDIASSIRLLFSEVVFDSAKAIVCPAAIRSREDIEAWRIIVTQTLTG